MCNYCVKHNIFIQPNKLKKSLKNRIQVWFEKVYFLTVQPVLFFFFCAIISHSVFGQVSAQYWNPVNKTFTVNDGLPSMECYSTFQDSKGYVWVATDHGVAKYNGHSFDVITTNDGLGSNTVYDILEDKQGRIWFFSNIPELYFLEDGKVKPFKYNSKLKEIQPAFFRYHDQFLFEGNIVLSTLELGTFTISDQGEVGIFDAENVQSNDDKSLVFSLVKQHVVHGKQNAEIVPSTQENIEFRNDKVTHKEKFVLGMSFEMLHHQETSYIALNKELWVIEGDKSSMYTFNEQILTIAFINNDVWLGFSKAGVKRLRLDNGTIVSEEHFFRDKTISDIAQTTDGSIWLSTLDEGLFQIQNLKLESLNSESGSKPVHSIVKVKNHLLLRSYTTINALNLKTLEIDRSFNSSKSLLSLPNGELAVFSDFIKYSDGTHPLYYLNDVEAIETNASKFHRVAYEVKKWKSNVYIVGTRYGVSFLNSSRIPIEVKTGVRALEIYDDAHLWISNFRSTSILNINTGELSEPSQPELRGRAVNILKAPNGVTYFATHGDGIWVLGDTLQHFTSSNGLRRNFIFKIIHKRDNQFWLVSHKGMSLVDFDGNRVHVIRDITSNDLSCEKISDCNIINDTIYLATNTGARRITSFNAPTPSNLKIYSKGVIVGGRQMGVKPFELKYTESDLRFEFDAVSFSGEPVYFRYKIGSSNPWSVTTERFANYTDLPPGEYSFQLEASTDGKYWMVAQPINFQVHPPFWGTAWFRLLIVALLIVLIFLIVRWRLDRLKAKEKVKNRIIELQQVALTQQLNPHFVFNAMGSLQNSILKGDAEKANEYIVDFSRFLRSGLEASRMELIPLTEEMTLMENYLLLEQKRMVGKFTFEIQADNVASPELIFIPPFIAQPFLENAIKHGVGIKEGEGHIMMKFEQLGDTIQCIIEDDGVGLKSDMTEHKSHGISIAHERIQLLHKLQGNKPNKLPLLQLSPRVGGGTIVRFSLPIIRNDVKSDNY